MADNHEIEKGEPEADVAGERPVEQVEAEGGPSLEEMEAERQQLIARYHLRPDISLADIHERQARSRAELDRQRGVVADFHNDSDGYERARKRELERREEMSPEVIEAAEAAMVGVNAEIDRVMAGPSPEVPGTRIETVYRADRRDAVARLVVRGIYDRFEAAGFRDDAKEERVPAREVADEDPYATGLSRWRVFSTGVYIIEQRVGHEQGNERWESVDVAIDRRW